VPGPFALSQVVAEPHINQEFLNLLLLETSKNLDKTNCDYST